MNFEIWCLQQSSYRNREGLIFGLEIQIIYIVQTLTPTLFLVLMHSNGIETI